MKKIILKILLSLSIYSIICYKCEDSETDKNKCLGKPDGKYPDVCCFFQEVVKNVSKETHCKAIPYSSYNDKDKYENIDGVLYQVTCDTGNRKVTLLEECGNTNEANEANYEKCKKHSTVLNSCCYVKGNGDINKGCYWLGTKYEGDISWAGVEMECSMDYLKYSIIYLIFIFLFF